MTDQLFLRLEASPTSQFDVQLRQAMIVANLPPDLSISSEEERSAWVEESVQKISTGVRTVLESIASDQNFNNNARHMAERSIAAMKAQIAAIDAGMNNF